MCLVWVFYAYCLIVCLLRGCVGYFGSCDFCVVGLIKYVSVNSVG